MAEDRKYTIVVKKNRVEVSREVYYAYHQAREAERYQMLLVHQREMSLERFQEEGVNVEYLGSRHLFGIEEKLIKAEEILQLYQALDKLTHKERVLLEELFFKGSTEEQVAQHFGVTQQAVNKQKQKSLKKLRIIYESLCF